MIISTETHGVDDLLRTMQELPGKLRKKHIRQSLNKAATPILKEDRRLYKAALKSFNKAALNKRTFTSAGKVSVVIGPDRRRKKKTGKFVRGAALIHLFELGTKDRFRSAEIRQAGGGFISRKVFTGAIKPMRLLDKGFRRQRGTADRILEQELTKRIQQEWDG